MNEYQDPNWVQAAEFFIEIIIPCGLSYFSHDGLLKLAKDIIKRAKANNCRVNYFYGSGYNVIANNPTIEGFTRKETVDYSDKIHKIEQWITNYQEFWAKIYKK